MSGKIVQIIPCSGWAFEWKDEHGQRDGLHVAAWALLESGDVIGLTGDLGLTGTNGVPKLNAVRAPRDIRGKYVLRKT